MPKATHSPEIGETETLLKLITDRGGFEFDREREGAWIEVIRKIATWNMGMPEQERAGELPPRSRS